MKVVIFGISHLSFVFETSLGLGNFGTDGVR